MSVLRGWRRARAHSSMASALVAPTEAAEWVPTQYTVPDQLDLRNSKLGPKGFKETGRKRRLEQIETAAMDIVEDAPSTSQAAGDESEPGSKRQRLEGVHYRTVRIALLCLL